MAIKKILIIKLREMGDTVLLTAPLLALRECLPGATIHVLTDSRWKILLDKHPAMDKLWTLDRKKRGLSRIVSLGSLVADLRRERFDAVVNFHASTSSAWVARLSGAPIRSVHFHGHDVSNRFSTVSIPGKGTLKPIIERDMDALRALGLTISEGRLPKLFPSDSGADASLAAPLLVLSLGAGRPTKAWPSPRFAEVAKGWLEATRGSVVAVAGPSEDAILEQLKKEIPESFHERVRFTHQLSLSALCSLFSAASVFVGNDSGPKHIAVALGTPTVTIFGPEDPFEWHPYPPEQHPYFFVKALSCRKQQYPGMPPWCGVRMCHENHRCMMEISAQEVLKEALRLAKTDGRGK